MIYLFLASPQADYNMEHVVYELNKIGVELAVGNEQLLRTVVQILECIALVSRHCGQQSLRSPETVPNTVDGRQKLRVHYNIGQGRLSCRRRLFCTAPAELIR